MTTKNEQVKATPGLTDVGRNVAAYKFGFAFVFLTVLFISTTILAVLDLLPEVKEAVSARVPALVAAPVARVTAPELPTTIAIPSIDVEATIANPTSTSVPVLDEALHGGVVRYPTSAKLGEEGNVIIFGHSSYLPVVRNQSFKAFNNIQKLKKGDQILVTSGTRTYVYAVDTVREADAGEDEIPLTATGNTLTLATCDSFGEKSDRFIVTATLISVETL